jgi:ATP-dependent HslUV protease ATP-binding subunit HslU
MERLLDEISFEAPDRSGTRLRVDDPFVRERLEALVRDEDLARYIL